MKFGLIHYNAPGETLEEFLDYAAGAGFDGVELQSRDIWSGDEPGSEPERQAERVRRMVLDRGLCVGALSANNDFLTADPAELERQVVRLKRVCSLAQILDCRVLRCDGGWPRQGKELPPEERWADVIAEGFKRCAPFLENLGIVAGLDNHGTVTNDARFQLQILGMVGSPNVGTTIDTMNYRWMGHAIETCTRFVELSAWRAVHLHLKDGLGSRGDYRGQVLGEGEVDLTACVRHLKTAGYDGLWCAEYEGREPDGYTRCLAWMKANVPAL